MRCSLLILSLSLSLSLSVRFNGRFSRLTWVSRYQKVSTVDCVGAEDDGGGGDNCSYKTRKAPVTMSPPTS